MEVPQWLDTDFLYRINYGPGTVEDVARATRVLENISDRKARERITLLDRYVALELHQTLFAFSTRKSPFKFDWLEALEDVPALIQQGELKDGRISPFDYPPFNDEVETLMWVEEYTVRCVWSTTYSSHFLGKTSRPSLSAVACDIMTVLRSLQRAQNGIEGAPIKSQLLYGPYNHLLGLFSIPDTHPHDLRNPEVGSEGFLFDLFSLVIAQHPMEAGWDSRLPSIEPDKVLSLIQHAAVDPRRFPGPEALNLGTVATYYNQDVLQMNLNDLRASVLSGLSINIGLTTDSSEHLVILEGEIKLFWEGGWDECDFPGRKNFMRYRNHTLGRWIRP